MGESKGAELVGNVVRPGHDTELTHKLTLAEVEEIHKHGSPHQHLDPTPHTREPQIIPRYLRRAVWSKNPVKVHMAVQRAERDGWTRAEMLRQVKLINEESILNKEYEIQE